MTKKRLKAITNAAVLVVALAFVVSSLWQIVAQVFGTQ
jgi:hypothetical protein